MGSSTSKFRKALQRGEGVEAMHIYLKNPDIKRNLDPNYSFGVNHGHNTALHFAAMHAMKAFIREFLEERANPNIRNGAGQNALHCICSTYRRGETSVDKTRAECLSNLLGWNANLQEGTAIEIDARDEVQYIRTLISNINMLTRERTSVELRALFFNHNHVAFTYNF